MIVAVQLGVLFIMGQFRICLEAEAEDSKTKKIAKREGVSGKGRKQF